MAGYSGTPLPKKLGIKDDSHVVLVGAPKEWAIEGVTATRSLRGKADVIVAFFRRRADLEARIAALGDAIFPAGAVWIGWPRKAAGHVSDITENDIRDIVLPRGLVDVKVAALDEDWSGLKLMWRKDRR